MIQKRSNTTALSRRFLVPGVLGLASLACNSETANGVGTGAAEGPGAGVPAGGGAAANPGGEAVPTPGGGAATPGSAGGAPGDVTPGETAESAAPGSGRRLTKTEYLFTVEDVLGVQSQEISDLIVPDGGGEGFRNAFAALLPSGKRTNAFADAAALVAGQMTPETITQYTEGCAEFTEACMSAYVNNVGRLMFRRPLADRETTLYTGLFSLVEERGDNFEFAARYVVEALLQSPYFLYRVERADRLDGDRRMVDGYELATRLSYLMWQSAPDSALLDAVAADGLNASNVRATVEGMMASPKFRRAVRTFVSEWLQLYSLDLRSRDEGLYPEFGPQLVSEMREETLSYFERIVLDDKAPFMQAYTGQQTTVTEGLAELYGLPGAGSQDLSGNVRRSGFMTQASVLTTHSIADSTSIVDRGLFVLGRLLCRPVPTPPEDLQELIEEAKKNVNQDQVQRGVLEEHRDDPKCSGCHALFDPLGYAFEAYDGIGRFQTEDTRGYAIATDGEAPVDGAAQPYTDASEFADILGGSTWAKQCVVKQVTQFAYGRVLDGNDTAMLKALTATFDESNQDLSDLFLQVALSPPMQRYVPPDQSLSLGAAEEAETP